MTAVDTAATPQPPTRDECLANAAAALRDSNVEVADKWIELAWAVDPPAPARPPLVIAPLTLDVTANEQSDGTLRFTATLTPE